MVRISLYSKGKTGSQRQNDHQKFKLSLEVEKGKGEKWIFSSFFSYWTLTAIKKWIEKMRFLIELPNPSWSFSSEEMDSSVLGFLPSLWVWTILVVLFLWILVSESSSKWSRKSGKSNQKVTIFALWILFWINKLWPLEQTTNSLEEWTNNFKCPFRRGEIASKLFNFKSKNLAFPPSNPASIKFCYGFLERTLMV